MKKIILYLLTIFLFIYAFQVVVSANIDNVKYKLSSISEIYFENKVELNDYYIVKDFLGNEFIVCEFYPASYMILYEKTYLFIEGSNEINSPFYSFDFEKKYNGFGSYYILIDSLIYDILNNKYYIYNDYIDEFISLSNKYHDELCTYISNNNSPTLNVNSYHIEHSSFFENYLNFPINNSNMCGIVALSILLCYFDIFFNPNTIPERDELPFLNYNETLINSFYGTDIYDLLVCNNPPSISINLYNQLKSYNYTLNPFYGIGSGDLGTSFPMNGANVQNTFFEYANEFIDSDNLYYYNSSGFIGLDNDGIRNLLQQNFPNILVLNAYSINDNIEEENEYFHIVIAYGYINDSYICHYGWLGRGYQNIILTPISTNASIAISYYGNHVHNYDLKWKCINDSHNCNGSYCTCNQFFNMSGHSFISNSLTRLCAYCGFGCINHNYIYTSYNSTRHNLRCSICGYITQDNHVYYYRNLRYYCKYCPYISNSGIGTYD